MIFNFNGQDININNFNPFIDQKELERKKVTYTINIWIGDAQYQPQTIKCLPIQAEREFTRIAMDLHGNSAPMKCKMSYEYYLKDGSINEDYIEYMNNAWTNAHKKD